MPTTSNTSTVQAIGYVAQVQERDNNIIWQLVNAAAAETGLRVAFVSSPPFDVATPEQIFENYGSAEADLLFAHGFIPVGGDQGSYNAEWWEDTPQGEVLVSMNYHPYGIGNPTYFERFHWHESPNQDPDHTLGFYDERIVYLPPSPRHAYDPGEPQWDGWVHTLADAMRKAVEPGLHERLAEARRESTVNVLVETMRNRNNGRLAQIQNELTDGQSQVIRLASELHRLEQRLPQLKAEYDVVRARSVNEDLLDASLIRTLVEKIETLPNVERITTTAESGILNITTGELPISVTMNDGQRFHNTVGPYRLDLDFVNIEVRAFNLNGPNEQMDHPHIDGGNFCLGGGRNLVYGLMKDAQFDVAVSVLIDQLQNVNPDDVYYGQWWDDFFPGQLDRYFEYNEESDEEVEEW